MFRKYYGKVLFVGLGMTLFAKAAVSVPLFPSRIDPVVIGPDEMFRTIAEEPEIEEEPDEIPPLVEGLSDTPGQCETPEEVLSALADEREAIENRKRELGARESEMALAREKLQNEKLALLELQSAIKDLLGKVDAAKTDDLQRLIEFYKNMKPADAARIMDDMDIETTIMVLGTMKPRVAAPILAKMSAVRARAVSKIILERSQLPGDQDLVGIRLN